MTLHAQGAQVYECRADKDGKLAWAFREPIASLFLDGKTVGRHYAGPNWEHMDGSAVVAKAAGNAPGATPKDIPWLKLAVTSHRGKGVLSGITTIQRINTSGGVHVGRVRQGRHVPQRGRMRRITCSCGNDVDACSALFPSP